MSIKIYKRNLLDSFSIELFNMIGRNKLERYSMDRHLRTSKLFYVGGCLSDKPHN